VIARLPIAFRSAVWIVTGTLVVLSARAFAYSFGPPSPLGPSLAGDAGGPSLLAVGLGACVVGFALAAATVALSALAVAERRRLEPRAHSESERIRPLGVVVHALGLFVATSLAFALVESYVHWRAGLGWHGFACLVGPVHRDAIPLLAALSALGAAAIAAAEHVLAWVRRTIGRLAERIPVVGPALPLPAPLAAAPSAHAERTDTARAPPHASLVRPAGRAAGTTC